MTWSSISQITNDRRNTWQVWREHVSFMETFLCVFFLRKFSLWTNLEMTLCIVREEISLEFAHHQSKSFVSVYTSSVRRVVVVFFSLSFFILSHLNRHFVNTRHNHTWQEICHGQSTMVMKRKRRTSEKEKVHERLLDETSQTSFARNDLHSSREIFMYLL